MSVRDTDAVKDDIGVPKDALVLDARLRAVADASPEPIVLRDRESRTLMANPAALTALGRSSAQVIGRTPEQYADDPSAGRASMARDQRILATGLAETTEETVQTPAGPRHYRTSESPFRDDAGAIVGLIGTVRDVTEQRRAEERLHVRQDRHAMRQFIAHDPLGCVGMDGRIVECNDLYCVLTGYSRDELATMTFQDLTPERWHAMEAEILAKQVLRRGYSDVYETEYRRKDGTVIPVELRVVLARDEGGRPDSMWAIVRDISERKQAQDALRRSEEQLRSALEIGRGGTWESVPATGEFKASDAAMALHGMAPGTPMTHEAALAAVHPDDRARVKAALRRALDTGERLAIDLRCIHPDGSIHWLHSQAEVRRDGAHPRLVGIVQDITARKLAEEREHLLLREVNHRSKNLLALVIAIVRQTAEHEPDDLAGRIEARLLALAASHDLLVGTNWRRVPLDALVRSQLGHFAHWFGTRILLSGPAVEVSASAAQSIGMALHELATNAAKYGALSNATGTVTIGWEMSDRPEGPRFSMRWTEAGGPRVGKPRRRGFGSVVTGDLLRIKFDAEVATSYAPAGLTWTLSCDAAGVLEDGAA